MLATIDGYILAFSSLTVIVTIWMGFRSAKTSKTASDFFVAGRSVSVGWNASAISGEYLSAASFMGIAGMVMSSGYDALWYPVCYACGYLFLLLFIAGPLRRFGAYTIPDFAEGRFDSPLFRKIAVCFVLFIGFFYTMPQMKGAGTTLAYIFPGLPYWAGVVLVGAVITLNVALGGMKGITLVQAFQYWAKMFAISVPIFVLMAVYGHYGKQLGANGDTSGNSAKAFPNDIEWVTAFQGSNTVQKLVGDAQDLWGQNVTGTRGGNRESGFVASTNTLFNLLSAYHDSTWNTVLRDKDLPNSIIQVETNMVAAAEFPKAIEGFLNHAGIVLIHDSANTVKVVSESKLKSIRKSLPEKAPADSTWLSPFGPLTTKAAKAAFGNDTNRVGRLKSGVNLEFESLVEGGSFGEKVKSEINIFFHEQVAQDARRVPHQVGFVNNTNSVLLMLRNYWGGIGGAVFVAKDVPDKLIFTGTNTMSVTAHSQHIKELLAANGIALLEEGRETVKAVSADKVELVSVAALKTKPYALLYTYSLIIALVCGTAGLPHILVRFYTNPDGGAAKRTTMWVMILIGIFYVFPPVFGVMGRNLFPELYNGIGAKGTDKIVLELPRLLNEKYAPLGSILSGITCAGAFAAFMSTFSGLLVSMTGALAHDVYGRMLRPKSTPEQRMRMFKFAAVLIGFVSILLGSLVEPLEINFMVGQAFAIAAASYFPLLFMSVWWRGMTMRGAAVGMLTGGLCALAAATLTNVSNLALDKGPMGKIFAGFAGMNDYWAHHPLLRILCEQPAIWTVPLAITLMIVVSKATRKDVPSDVRMKMLVLHAPEKLGLKQEYIQEHQAGH